MTAVTRLELLIPGGLRPSPQPKPTTTEVEWQALLDLLKVTR